MQITNSNKRFGIFVTNGRIKRGLSQEEVAHLLDISQSYYSYIEKGKRNIDLSLALSICAVLKLDITEFVNEENRYYRKSRP